MGQGVAAGSAADPSPMSWKPGWASSELSQAPARRSEIRQPEYGRIAAACGTSSIPVTLRHCRRAMLETAAAADLEGFQGRSVARGSDEVGWWRSGRRLANRALAVAAEAAVVCRASRCARSGAQRFRSSWGEDGLPMLDQRRRRAPAVGGFGRRRPGGEGYALRRGRPLRRYGAARWCASMRRRR